MPNTEDVGGVFSWEYVVPPVPPVPPTPIPQPVVLRDIKRQRDTVKPLTGSTALPLALMERLYNLGSVPISAYEPDPRTHREDYYYNSKLNRLYVKVKTSPVPVWRPFGG